MHLTLQQMRLFEAVARHHSFTRAAEELHLTQPAVSIQLKRLEENAGVRLFEHMGKRLFLTPSGHAVHAACLDVLGRLRSLDDALDDIRETVRGPLDLAVVTSAKYFIPHYLGAFIGTHPEVIPRLTVTNRTRVIERLADNRDDFVIMGQVPPELDVRAYPFLDNLLMIVAHPSHRLAGRTGIPLAALAEERMLVRERGSGTRMALERMLADHGATIRPYMELGSTEAIKQGVMANLGLSILPRRSMELELETSRLITLDIDGFPLLRQWNVVHLSGKTLSKVARTFLESLLAGGPGLAMGQNHFS
ncbi:LysR family transcriptional regulator [Magnetospirillum sp. UT-4]|uniref:LysR family transcriptional regulator n=1 Tax=Magnetospirillum sp. UT-4 TaxID=2681467 RepID=UPI001382F7DB|nr:LysR family transcriptional regulator [Magnetospirillum sp. UT-4]CAA7619634.1 RuBisCO operon transcriptional regulator [Magnetospirillum sp. UT-4]